MSQGFPTILELYFSWFSVCLVVVGIGLFLSSNEIDSYHFCLFLSISGERREPMFANFILFLMALIKCCCCCCFEKVSGFLLEPGSNWIYDNDILSCYLIDHIVMSAMFFSTLIVPGSGLYEIRIEQTLTKTSELNEQVFQIPMAFTRFTLTSLIQLISSPKKSFLWPIFLFLIYNSFWQCAHTSQVL